MKIKITASVIVFAVIILLFLLIFIGEIQYDTVDTTKCFTDDHPGPEYRLRYLHTIASTQKYIVIPETSYTEDVCFSRIGSDDWHSIGPVPYWVQNLNYTKEVNGRFSILNKVMMDSVY